MELEVRHGTFCNGAVLGEARNQVLAGRDLIPGSAAETLVAPKLKGSNAFTSDILCCHKSCHGAPHLSTPQNSGAHT